MIEIIRCRNWEEEPEICHIECGIEFTPDPNSHWISAVLDTDPEWFVVLRSCQEHGRHADPFCCINCFQRYHSRHEHA